jgi:chromosome segregation ATPase
MLTVLINNTKLQQSSLECTNKLQLLQFNLRAQAELIETLKMDKKQLTDDKKQLTDVISGLNDDKNQLFDTISSLKKENQDLGATINDVRLENEQLTTNNVECSRNVGHINTRLSAMSTAISASVRISFVTFIVNLEVMYLLCRT